MGVLDGTCNWYDYRESSSRGIDWRRGDKRRPGEKARAGSHYKVLLPPPGVVVLQGDCVELMRALPEESIRMVVTSPPYNIKNSTGNGLKDGRGGKWPSAALQNGYSEHDDCMPHDEYVDWQRECLAGMMRVLRPDGAIFYNHKWRVQNGLLQDRHDIVDGFPVRQIIIWQRAGGINFNPGYFLPNYEVIYLIAKPEFRLAPKANAYGSVWSIKQEHDNPHPAPFPIDLELAEKMRPRPLPAAVNRRRRGSESSSTHSSAAALTTSGSSREIPEMAERRTWKSTGGASRGFRMHRLQECTLLFFIRKRNLRHLYTLIQHFGIVDSHRPHRQVPPIPLGSVAALVDAD